MAHDVFISYASSDKAVADAVCSQLESIHRIRCWIAPRDVTPGASWAESIIDALDGSKIMVLIFSSSANASMQIEREVERAVHKGINIIPLRIENAMPTKTLEYFISAPHWLDALTTPLEDHISKLAQSVKALLSKQGVHAPAQPATAKVTIPPPVRVQSAAGAAKTNSPQSWIVPAAISAVVVVAALVLGARFMSSRRPAPAAANVQAPAAQPPAAATSTSAAGTAASATAAPATPTTSTPAAATPAPAATNTPAAGTATTPGIPPAAAAAAVGAKTEPNLFIDFRNTLEEGTMTLEIDGQTRWTTKLGARLKPEGKDNPRFEDLRTSLSIPSGRHKVTATLKTPDGKVRDTDSTAITIPEGAPRTLRVRLSRFRHHVEFQEVAGRQVPNETPAAATQKPSASATAKPAAQGRPAPAAAKPASATSTPAPATTKPAAAPK